MADGSVWAQYPVGLHQAEGVLTSVGANLSPRYMAREGSCYLVL